MLKSITFGSSACVVPSVAVNDVERAELVWNAGPPGTISWLTLDEAGHVLTPRSKVRARHGVIAFVFANDTDEEAETPAVEVDMH